MQPRQRRRQPVRASGAPMPPAGFEPALPEERERVRDAAVTGTASLPDALRAKLEELKERADA